MQRVRRIRKSKANAPNLSTLGRLPPKVRKSKQNIREVSDQKKVLLQVLRERQDDTDWARLQHHNL